MPRSVLTRRKLGCFNTKYCQPLHEACSQGVSYLGCEGKGSSKALEVPPGTATWNLCAWLLEVASVCSEAEA